MPQDNDFYLGEAARKAARIRRDRQRNSLEVLGRMLDSPDGLAFVADQLRDLGLLAPLPPGDEAARDRHNRAVKMFRSCAKARGAAALAIVRGMIEDWNC